jgi:enoyl-CoA hydratase/carnithine racemase
LSLRLDHGGPWARIKIDRPPQNLLAPDLLAALLETLDALEAGGAPPLLLAAAGRHFSTGYPVDAIPEEIFHADPKVRAKAPFERVMARLADYPAPVVAAIQGDAFGGAVELLCCADLRLGVRGCRVGVPAARLGLIYSLSGLRRMGAAFGWGLTRELLLTGEPVEAERAYDAGFLNRLCPPERLEAEAESLMESVAAGAPLALRGTKRALGTLVAAETLPQSRVREIAAARHEAWRSEDFREAQAAFVEKRRPRFRGR